MIEFIRRATGLPDGRVRVRLEVRAGGRGGQRLGVIRHESERPGWRFTAAREAGAAVRAIGGREWSTAAEAREGVQAAVFSGQFPVGNQG